MLRKRTPSVEVALILALTACSGSGSAGDADRDAGETVASDGGSSGDAGSSNSSDAGADAGTSIVDLALTGCPQAGYTAKFSVGGSPFDLVVDTGSVELGVASSTCSNCSGVSPLYTPSSGATDEAATVSVSYVSGSGWSGEIFLDTFGAGGSSSPAISAPTKLVAIQSESGGFFTNGGCAFGSIPFTFEGIAGFGPAALAKTGTDEPMAALAGAGVVDIFSVALCGSGGQMWLGGFDPASATASPKYTPLLANSYYAVKVNGLRVGATSLGLSAADIEDVVVDTDTTEFELPPTAYGDARDAIAADSAFQAHFGGASFFNNGSCVPPLDASPPTPAALDAALPSFTLQIDDGAGGSNDVTWTATNSYLEPILKDGVTYYCPEIESRLGSSTVLGSALLRSQVVIFDRANGRVGFAPHAGCAQ